MRELFVYYRVRSVDAAALLPAVQAMQAGLLARHPHLVMRVLRRAEVADGVQTWMETYATEPGGMLAGVAPDLQAEIEVQAAPLASLIDGTRHTEVFIPCASSRWRSSA